MLIVSQGGTPRRVGYTVQRGIIRCRRVRKTPAGLGRDTQRTTLSRYSGTALVVVVVVETRQRTSTKRPASESAANRRAARSSGEEAMETTEMGLLLMSFRILFHRTISYGARTGRPFTASGSRQGQLHHQCWTSIYNAPAPCAVPHTRKL
jgi:hypothetical protein